MFPEGAPDEDALEGEAARVALLRDRVHVALAVAAGRVLEARARGGQLGQLQQVRCCRLDSTQEGVQPAGESQPSEWRNSRPMLNIRIRE